MRILVLRTLYPHWGGHSGFNQFLRYLDPKEYEVEVWDVPDNDEAFPLQNKRLRKELLNLVQKKGMPWYKLSDLTAEMKALRKCWREKIDIVHFLDGEHSAQFLPKILKWLPGKRPKVMVTYHQPHDLLPSLTRDEVIRQLDFITVVSPEQMPYFLSVVGPQRVRSILHGIDIDYFRPETKQDSKYFRCITVGHYLRDFNVFKEVADRLKSHREIEFHLVSSRVSGLEKGENIILHRNIDDDQLLSLYKRSDVLFLPLLNSTANNSLLEGIACGLPVVSTRLNSVKSYLSGEEGVLVEDSNPEGFSQAILFLLNNPIQRAAMGREARKRAKELDWRNIAPQYGVVYSHLMRG